MPFVYVIAGFGAMVFVPVVSVALFLWGLGGLFKGKAAIEPEDEET